MGQEILSQSPIHEWPVEDRPREKLFRLGESRLSNSELMAILLRTGCRGESALDLSRRIMRKFKTFRNMSHTDSREWQEFKGVGSAKMAQIRAALEIGRRFREDEIRETQPQIKSSREIVDILMPRMRDLKTEIFKAVFLNSQHRIIDILDVAEGTVNRASPFIREIFQQALQRFAVALICAHNHPSGDSTPSPEDRQFTRDLCEAGRILQVRLLDHLILGDNVYYSFAEAGAM